MVGGIESAMDDMKLVPMLVVGPAHQLAAAVGTDGGNKGGGRRLQPQSMFVRPIEFFRAVNSDAERDSGQFMDERRDRCRVCSKVDVDVFNVIAAAPVCDDQCLSKIG